MIKKYASNDVGSLLRRINLIELIKYLVPNYSGTLSTRGKHRSPFRVDNNPSFTIRTINGIDEWYDWATRERGNAVDAVVKVRACTVIDAIQFLISWVKEFDPSLIINDDNTLLAEVEEEINKEKCLKALLSCSRQLLHDTSVVDEGIDEIRSWLLDRGVPSLDYIKSFSVGLWDYKSLKPYLHENLVSSYLNLSAKTDLGSIKQTPGLLFFYYSSFGKLSSVKYRPLGGSSNDCVFLTKKRQNEDIGFFGLEQFPDTGVAEAILVEGEFDWIVPQSIMVRDLGDPGNFICRGGSAGSSSVGYAQLKQLGFDVVTIWPDNDTGGDNFVEESATNAKAARMTLKVFTPTGYSARTPGINEDPAVIAQRLNCANMILKDISNNSLIFPKWIANRKVTQFLRSTKQGDAEFRALISGLVESASEFDFSDFDLDDFCNFVTEKLPTVKSDSLRKAIEHSERAFQKFKIGDDVWGVDNYGYNRRKFDKASGEDYFSSATNWTIKLDKIVTGDSGSNSIVNGSIFVNGKKLSSFKDRLETFTTGADIVKLVRSSCPVGISVDRATTELLPSLVSMSNEDARVVKGISKIGYLQKRPIYVTSNMVIDGGEILLNHDEYETNFSGAGLPESYRFHFESSKLELGKVMKDLIHNKLLNILERRYTILTLGHIMSAICVPFLPGSVPPPTTLFHRAKRGTGKTTCAKVFMNLFADWPFDKVGPNARSTRNALEKELHHFRNAPIFIDDVKGSAKDIKDIMLLVQSNYDQQGRQRLNQDLTSRRAYNMQCWGLMLTGEDIPTDQASTLSRMITVATSMKLNTSIVDYLLQDSIRLRLASITPHFISWLQRKNELEYIEMPTLSKDEVRPWYQLRTMLTGLDAFYRFAVEELKFPENEYKELIEEALDYVPTIYEENTFAAEEMAQDRQFWEVLMECIASGEAKLTCDEGRGIQVGAVKRDGLYLMPNQCVSLVQKKTGRNYFVNDLSQDLYHSNLIAKVGKNLLNKTRINGSFVQAWKVNISTNSIDLRFYKGNIIDDSSDKSGGGESDTADKKEDG